MQYVLIELCFYLISWILMSSCFWEKKIRLDSQRQTFLIFIWIFFFLKMACYHAILAICWRYPHFEMGLCLWTEEILAKYQNILISVLLSESSDESPFFISIVFKKKKKPLRNNMMMRMTNIYRTVRWHLQWKVPIWKTYKPEANFKYSPLVMGWILDSTQKKT